MLSGDAAIAAWSVKQECVTPIKYGLCGVPLCFYTSLASCPCVSYCTIIACLHLKPLNFKLRQCLDLSCCFTFVSQVPSPCLPHSDVATSICWMSDWQGMFRKPPSPQKKKKKKIANCVYLMITIEPSCGRQEDVLPRSPFKKGLAALCRIHLETDQDRVTVLASWARCETTLMGKICSGVRAW